MPRKKAEKPPVKFKYTIRRDGILYVKYPQPGLKNPVWRICREETQEAVNLIIAGIEAHYLKQSAGKSDDGSVEGFFRTWLETIKPTIAPRTFADYSELYDRYLKKPLGKFSLAEAKPLDIQKLYNNLNKRVAAGVVKKVHVVLTSAFKQAIVWKLLTENPAKDLVLPREVETEAPAMSTAEARAFIAACGESLSYIVLEFALETGLRPEEYLALDWAKGIDLEKRRVHVRRAVSFARGGGGYVFKETKTKSSRRTVSFSPAMQNRLIELKAAQEKIKKHLRERIAHFKKPVRAKFTPKTTPNRGANQRKREDHLRVAQEKLQRFNSLNLVFPAANGNPMSLNNLGRREFKDVLKKAELDAQKYYLYSLRHTCASLLAEKIKPRRLQVWLGHKTIATTFKYYVHITGESSDETAEILADLLY